MPCWITQKDVWFGPSPSSWHSSFSGCMMIMPQKQLSETIELHVPTKETGCAIYAIAEDDVKSRLQGFSRARHHSFSHKIRPGPWLNNAIIHIQIIDILVLYSCPTNKCIPNKHFQVNHHLGKVNTVKFNVGAPPIRDAWIHNIFGVLQRSLSKQVLQNKWSCRKDSFYWNYVTCAKSFKHRSH